jgi:hypothetical protein
MKPWNWLGNKKMQSFLRRKMKLKRGTNNRRKPKLNQHFQRREKTKICPRDIGKETKKLLNRLGKKMKESMKM